MSAEGFSAGFDDRLKTVSDRLKGSVEKLTSNTISSTVTTNNYATRSVSAPVTNNISLNVDSVETLNRIIERFSGERRHIRMGVVR